MPKPLSAFQVLTKMPKLIEITNITSYVAVSHVWSDGTGIGLKEPGHVNKCRLYFFSRYMECDVAWWDAICISTVRE